MAVNFKKKDQYDIIKKLGGAALALDMKNHGIKISTAMKGFIVEFKDYSVVVPKVAPLAQLKVGVSKNIAEKQLAMFSSAVAEVMVGAPPKYWSDKSNAIKSDDKVSKEDVPDTLPDDVKLGSIYGKGEVTMNDKVLGEVIGIDFGKIEKKVAHKVLSPEASQIMSGDQIVLSNATEVYQPVKSTSDGSKYYVVAVTKDLKVAARLKGNNVSVRAEGNIDKYEMRLIAAGFSNHKSYASFHVSASTSVLRCKVVGAALFGLNVQFGKIVQHVGLLDNKGV